MRKRYRAVEMRLKRLDWESLWPGFSASPFALYDEVQACMADGCTARPEVFRGNTAIVWQGKATAIWNLGLDPVADDDVLTAMLVHEMFHAHQREAGERRYPNDLRMLRCPPSAKALALRVREHRLLAEGCADAMVQVIALRRLRAEIDPEDAQQGFLAETIEGMAEWVGLCALAQLNPEKADMALQRHARTLTSMDERQLDTRRMAYASGTFLLNMAVQAGLKVHHPLGGTAQSLSEWLGAQVSDAPAAWPSSAETEVWQTILNRWRVRQAERLATFRKGRRERVCGDYTICGYDPMNMLRVDDEVLCTSFVVLASTTGETCMLNGEALLRMGPGSDDRVLGWMR